MYDIYDKSNKKHLVLKGTCGNIDISSFLVQSRGHVRIIVRLPQVKFWQFFHPTIEGISVDFDTKRRYHHLVILSPHELNRWSIIPIYDIHQTNLYVPNDIFSGSKLGVFTLHILEMTMFLH